MSTAELLLDDFWMNLNNITKTNVMALSLDDLFALRRILRSERVRTFGDSTHRRKLACKITIVERAIVNLVPGALTFKENCQYADSFLRNGDYAMAARRYKMAGMALHLQWLEMCKSGRVGDERDEEIADGKIIAFDKAFDADARTVAAMGAK